jgi:hypothetical protein
MPRFGAAGRCDLEVGRNLLRQIVVWRQLVVSGEVPATVALGVANLFLPFAFGCSIVPDATLVRALLPMVLPAAEGAAQIETPGVAGIGEKPNPAVATAHDTAIQIAIVFQGRVECHLILTNKRTSAIVLVPILGKKENLLDGYGKKAKFSVTMRSSLGISSPYLLDARSSRGGARIFSAFASKPEPANRANHLRLIAHQERFSCPADPTSLCPSF